METSELIKKVRKIEIKTKGLSNHIFSGEYHSAFKGRGMSFSEVREYSYGDDIKAIDWNVTARFNTPYVKIFEEERELTVMLLVDISPSAFFGTANQMKNEMITEICAVLAFSAINNNDKVGVIFFSDKIEKFVPPKKGKAHVLRIIRELIEVGYSDEGLKESKTKESAFQQIKSLFQAKSKKETVTSKTDIELALKYFGNVIKKKCIAFLLSDFIDDRYEKSLNIVGRKHDLVGIRIYDPREQELPSVGLIRVKDAETGRTIWLDTANKAEMKRYKVNYLKNQDNCKQFFSRSGADLISIPTNRPYVKYLMNFFKKRGN
ncbi:MAG: DUF58 domain-containing protein [Chitinophagales bacterium]